MFGAKEWGCSECKLEVMSWKAFPQAVLNASTLLSEMNNSISNAFTSVTDRLNKFLRPSRPYASHNSGIVKKTFN
jgi:hypothetical protein